MKKIILTLISILSMNAFAEIEFICWENGACKGVPERVNVDISGFDSTLTAPLKSNWYSTDEDNGKYSVDFWDDEIWEDNRQKYILGSLLKIITILQLQVIMA